MKSRWIVGFVLLVGLGAAPPRIATSPERGELLVRSYPAADLVASVRKGLLGDERPGFWPKVTDDELRLVMGIINWGDPRIWECLGGPGAIEYQQRTRSLVVRHTPDVQKRVEELLGEFRRCQDHPVRLEVSFIIVGVELFGKLGLNGDSAAVLDEPSVRRLLRAVRRDPNEALVRAKEEVGFDRQEVTFDLCDRRTISTGKVGILGVPHFAPVAIPYGPGAHSSCEARTPALAEDIQVYAHPTLRRDHKGFTLAVGVEIRSLDASWMSDYCGGSYGAGLTPAEKAAVLARDAKQPRIGSFERVAILKIRDGDTALLCSRACQGERPDQGPHGRLLVLVTPRQMPKQKACSPQ